LKNNEEKGGRKKGRGNSKKKRYTLCLYITGNTVRSLRSIQRLRDLCEKHLAGKYDLKVVDIVQQPELASEGQIIAAPTLIKRFPPPLTRLVGDLSDQQRVELALNLRG